MLLCPGLPFLPWPSFCGRFRALAFARETGACRSCSSFNSCISTSGAFTAKDGGGSCFAASFRCCGSIVLALRKLPARSLCDTLARGCLFPGCHCTLASQNLNSRCAGLVPHSVSFWPCFVFQFTLWDSRVGQGHRVVPAGFVSCRAVFALKTVTYPMA